ncbi:hypothetical protein [Chondromyces apiculatus]|uniref:hypothetical protein n=1 Tax=Chondromyces apiculatus TaxID=51 RepID=UPI0005C6E244|nr:hypothetical protein [Chondromyces apiculatus]
MRISAKVVAASCLAVSACLFIPREAAAQVPSVQRDGNWGTVSDVAMIIGTSSVFLMPRVYYSDPEATVGWKGRWHVSMLAPALTMAMATALVEVPIKNAAEGVRPGCSVDETIASVSNSGCETFGGPSTHAFASWGATGTGLGIFLMDTFRYSGSRFNVGGFIGNVAVPLTASIFTTVGRAVEPGNSLAYEDGLQITAGALPGFFVGLGVGLAYAALQRPNCGYGNSIFCW